MTRPHHCNSLAVSSMVALVFMFRWMYSHEFLSGVLKILSSWHDVTSSVCTVLISFRLDPCYVILKYLHFFNGPINCILLCASWISSLLPLVLLHPFVSMTTFHSHIKVMGWLKPYTLVISIKFVFELNVSERQFHELLHILCFYVWMQLFCCRSVNCVG
jgi:hypothetical protein